MKMFRMGFFVTALALGSMSVVNCSSSDEDSEEDEDEDEGDGGEGGGGKGGKGGSSANGGSGGSGTGGSGTGGSGGRGGTGGAGGGSAGTGGGGASGGTGGGGGTTTAALKFSTDIHPIFKAKCARCHDGAHNEVDSSHAWLMANAESGHPCTGPILVKSNAANSLLVKKMTSAPGCGARMPKDCTGDACVSTAELDKIKAWIDAGALKN